ncbi:GNAT family N-acetyltransferase [Pandoraea sputorum]|nr:GNAT family N-acetyltransferase [Pandoraea sputorum]
MNPACLAGLQRHVRTTGRERAAIVGGESRTIQRANLLRASFVSRRSVSKSPRLGADLIGFAEASMRRDYANGCDRSPAVFLEGIYVSPLSRRMGVARALCTSVEPWGVS